MATLLGMLEVVFWYPYFSRATLALSFCEFEMTNPYNFTPLSASPH
jgi:hypothetical protein